MCRSTHSDLLWNIINIITLKNMPKINVIWKYKVLTHFSCICATKHPETYCFSSKRWHYFSWSCKLTEWSFLCSLGGPSMWLTHLAGQLAAGLSRDKWGGSAPLSLCGLSFWPLTWQWPRAAFQEESPNMQVLDNVLLGSLAKASQWPSSSPRGTGVHKCLDTRRYDSLEVVT